MKSIQSLDDYEEIDRIVTEAKDSLETGERAGIHYELAWILRGFGIATNSREDTVKQGRKLLEQFEKENFR